MIKIDVTTDKIGAALARLSAAYEDMTDLMYLIGDDMVARTKANIDAGQSPDGTAFAPRSEATLDAYARAKPTAKVPVGGPLKLTGDMRDGISFAAASDHVDWGSNAVQAAVMQFGAAQGSFGARIGKDKNGRDFFMTIPWGDIPARPFLGVGPDDETAILATIEEYFEAIVDG